MRTGSAKKGVAENEKTRNMILGGHEITYECTRKKVKNVNLRVRSDGTLLVSAPFFVSDRQIDEIIKEKEAFILRALSRFAERKRHAPPHFSFTDGETLSLFGKEYRLYFTEEKNEEILEKEALTLYVRDKTDISAKKKALKAYLEKALSSLLSEMCLKIYPLFRDAAPEIKLRLMRARWGSCAPKKAVLTFNTNLAFCSVSCIEYVVMHEFTHFLHADHSPAFYAALTEKMPDWKERKQRLNAVPMADIFSEKV